LRLKIESARVPPAGAIFLFSLCTSERERLDAADADRYVGSKSVRIRVVFWVWGDAAAVGNP